MLTGIQTFLRRRAPLLFVTARAVRYALLAERMDEHTEEIALAICGRELEVCGGAFRGMKYLPVASSSGLLPKLAGTYELELQAVLEGIINSPYDRIVNVGCGEGYYAVGLALRMPAVEVIAFDTDIVARQRSRQLARLNRVGRQVRVCSACRPRRLARYLAPRTLVVSDCEGYEAELLGPHAVSVLARADILVEFHDFAVPEVSRILTQRFAATHEIVRIPVMPRDESHWRWWPQLSVEQGRLAVWEGRPEGNGWLWMRSIASDQLKA